MVLVVFKIEKIKSGCIQVATLIESSLLGYTVFNLLLLKARVYMSMGSWSLYNFAD